MKRVLMCIMMVLVLVSLPTTLAAQDDPVTLKVDSLDNSGIDTCYYDISNYDYFGIYMTCDSVMAADIYVDYRNGQTGHYATYSDSLITTSTSGAGKAITLRSPKTENVPWGVDFARFRISKRAAGNGGGTKTYQLIIDGIQVRQ